MKGNWTGTIASLASGLDHPEGLAFDADGNLWCGGEGGQIYCIDKGTTEAREVATTGGFCLGIAFDLSGRLWICDMTKQCVHVFDPRTKKMKTGWSTIADVKIRVPNVPYFDKDDTFWLSDSGDWGQSNGVIFRVDAAGRQSVWLKKLSFPNGIVTAPDGSALYVVQTYPNSILRVPIRKDGSAGKPEVFCAKVGFAPDGIAWDPAGRLIVVTYGDSGIYRVSKNKAVLLAKDEQGMQLNRPTNIAFDPTSPGTFVVANLGGYHLTRFNTTKTKYSQCTPL